MSILVQLKPRSTLKECCCCSTAFQWHLGKIVGVLIKFSSGQAHNLKFTASVYSAQQKSKELSQQGDFLNTDFFQVRLEALKESK